MKIGIVVHGPNIIDSGCACKIISLLSNFGDVKSRLGGTMGRTAVIDASMEKIIDISFKLLPSESVSLFKEEEVDVIFLLNYGKSSITGHTFGFKVFKNSFLESNDIFTKDRLSRNFNHDTHSTIPFIQVERPGEVDGSVIQWNGELSELTDKIAKLLNLKVLDPKTIIKKYFSDEIDNELDITFNGDSIQDSDVAITDIDDNEVSQSGVVLDDNQISDSYLNDINGSVSNSNMSISDDSVSDSDVINGGSSASSSHMLINDDLSSDSDVLGVTSSTSNSGEKIRKIYGVSPNENIFVNGVVIGKSTSENVSIVSKNGRIVDIIGGIIKPHGVEKLGSVNISKAIVKTGLLRKFKPNPRIVSKCDFNEISGIGNTSNENSLRIAFIDHAAENIYNLNNCDLVVTVGDDTTLIASDILYRFSIPVIGITDGDLDKVVEKGFKAKDSLIIELAEGLDDIIGRAIFDKIFDFSPILEINLNSEDSIFDNCETFNISDLKNKKIKELKEEILKIINNISPKYNIKY
ncbi:hypothetical protein MBCUT_09020 [Methanobrevibacter cuticularis]|uniref:DUF2117 domain-containing protein n=1 Tax=Methanobrevibacter cuticularis TaxID=47311 RepID=A0A166E742_9EURY|nr:DUF2117 domain-containing protein [Methanobrevibacter cuticularis]KZX16350.1 hypothetical protein MBCUT_09020 [Methanobrevibacter cuticularis]